jgi:hypothetical protein
MTLELEDNYLGIYHSPIRASSMAEKEVNFVPNQHQLSLLAKHITRLIDLEPNDLIRNRHIRCSQTIETCVGALANTIRARTKATINEGRKTRVCTVSDGFLPE